MTEKLQILVASAAFFLFAAMFTFDPAPGREGKTEEAHYSNRGNGSLLLLPERYGDSSLLHLAQDSTTPGVGANSGATRQRSNTGAARPNPESITPGTQRRTLTNRRTNTDPLTGSTRGNVGETGPNVTGSIAGSTGNTPTGATGMTGPNVTGSIGGSIGTLAENPFDQNSGIEQGQADTGSTGVTITPGTAGVIRNEASPGSPRPGQTDPEEGGVSVVQGTAGMP